jgi:hypothetical protein
VFLISVINYQKFIKDYITNLWDQTTYPADIRYFNRQEASRQGTETNIEIRIWQGSSDYQDYGKHAYDPQLDSNFVHIFLSVKDPRLDDDPFDDNEDYLKEVQKELYSILKSAQEFDIGIATTLDDGHYASSANIKVMSSTSLWCGWNSPNAFNTILIFEIEEIIDVFVDYFDAKLLIVDEATIEITVVQDFTDANAGYNIYLIDDDAPSYESGEADDAPRDASTETFWNYTGGTGTQETPDIKDILETYINRSTRDSTETRMGISIVGVTAAGGTDDWFSLFPIEQSATLQPHLKVSVRLNNINIRRAIRAEEETRPHQIDIWLEVKNVI